MIDRSHFNHFTVAVSDAIAEDVAKALGGTDLEWVVADEVSFNYACQMKSGHVVVVFTYLIFTDELERRIADLSANHLCATVRRCPKEDLMMIRSYKDGECQAEMTYAGDEKTLPEIGNITFTGALGIPSKDIEKLLKDAAKNNRSFSSSVLRRLTSDPSVGRLTQLWRAKGLMFTHPTSFTGQELARGEVMAVADLGGARAETLQSILREIGQ